MSRVLETGMRTRLILALFPLVVAIASPAWARGTLDDILPQIRAQHPGRLSDADPWTDANGNQHYRIKWMTPEGRIIYFDADTRTGRYTGAAGDEGNEWRSRRGRDDSEDRGQRSDSDSGNGGGRDHWNSEEGNGDGQGGGRGQGDWHGNSGGGDWHGHGDSQRGGDGRGHGGWRDGGNEGDNGGRHHHGNPQ